MANQSPFPEVHVAVALVVRDGRLLVIWNPSWSCFTLPMTKVRRRFRVDGSPDADSETARVAAIRAAAEAVGRPLEPSLLPAAAEKLELQPYNHRSGRDGQWKRYTREVFAFRVHDVTSPHGGAAHAWLTPDEARTLQPISPTVEEIVNHLDAKRFDWKSV